MQIKYFCSLWGMTHPTLEANLKQIKDAGFAGVELATPRQTDKRRQLRALLDHFDLQVTLLHSSLGVTAQEHAADLAQLLTFAAELQPNLINSHTGRDTHPLKESVRIIKQTNKLAAKLGLPIVHETHRGRAMYSIPATLAILDAIPNLRLNADLAHLCVVHQSYLQDQLDTLGRILQRSYYIHARVAYPEGSQVSDPRAPEWQQAVDYHIDWWQQIVDARRREGADEMIICTEFGPPNFMPVLPYTQQPVANLWEINLWIHEALKARIAKS